MIINNLDELKNFAKKLAPLLKKGDVINLVGDMGAGKTTLVSEICRHFDIYDTSSPTFAIVNIYEGKEVIYHLDLYRFEEPEEVLDIDFERYFYPESEITFIEWAENADGFLPDGMVDISIRKIDQDKRDITISGSKRAGEINELLGN